MLNQLWSPFALMQSHLLQPSFDPVLKLFWTFSSKLFFLGGLHHGWEEVKFVGPLRDLPRSTPSISPLRQLRSLPVCWWLSQPINTLMCVLDWKKKPKACLDPPHRNASAHRDPCILISVLPPPKSMFHLATKMMPWNKTISLLYSKPSKILHLSQGKNQSLWPIK